MNVAVAQFDDAVEHQGARLRFDLVGNEIAMAHELEALPPRRGGQAGLDERPRDHPD